MSFILTRYSGFGAARAADGVVEDTVTWNSADKAASITLSGSDLIATAASTAFAAVRATHGRSSGKRYFEILINTQGSTRCGFANSSHSLSTYIGNSARGASVGNVANSVNGYTVDNSGTFATANSDYFMFAVDLDAGKAWVGKNNAWQLSGDPAAGTGQWISGANLQSDTVYPAISVYEINTQFTLRTKNSEFSGTVPSGFSSWATP